MCIYIIGTTSATLPVASGYLCMCNTYKHIFTHTHERKREKENRKMTRTIQTLIQGGNEG